MTKPQSAWPTQAEYSIVDDPAMKKEEKLNIDFKQLFAMSIQKVDDEKFAFIMKLVNRYESWNKTIRLISRIRRLLPSSTYRRKVFSTEEKLKTENFIWSVSQQFHFPKEFDRLRNQLSIPEKSKLDIYNPYLDKEVNLIKSDSRLRMSGLPEEMKTSIILPKDCPIVEKFILDQHQLHQHAKTGYLHSLLRQRFILPSGKQMI
jgi:hypothetical protein